MKYICLGYFDEALWDGMMESERARFMDECFAYDEKLREAGHFAGGEALESTRSATTLRYRSDRVVITDGPFAETKEQLGGIMILEAGDLDQAIQLMSNHPSIRMGGTFEVRPAADLSSLVQESRKRRTASPTRPAAQERSHA
jgi:hypothetical protein